VTARPTTSVDFMRKSLQVLIPKKFRRVTIVYDMDGQTLKKAATDAIRFWEPRRLAYNAALAAIVLLYFVQYYPASKSALTFDAALGLFLLAVIANVAYCATYPADIFAQLSGYRDLWRRFRWIVFIAGVLVAAILTRFIALGMFQQSLNLR